MNSTWIVGSKDSQPLWGPGEPKKTALNLEFWVFRETEQKCYELYFCGALAAAV